MSVENGNTQVAKTWHVARYSGLAWLETIIKLVALAIALITFVDAYPDSGYDFPSGSALVQWGILVLLALALLGAIFDRILEREIIAMVFVIVNNLGHWSMVLLLTRVYADSTESAFLIFGALMLLADLIKLRLLITTRFTVRDVPFSIMVGLTLFFVVGYALILLLGLVG